MAQGLPSSLDAAYEEAESATFTIPKEVEDQLKKQAQETAKRNKASEQALELSPIPQDMGGASAGTGKVPYLSAFTQAAQKYNVPINVLIGLAEQESRFKPTALGTQTQWGRAKGIMQYLDSTAAGMGINPYDPVQSIDAAARQLRQRLDKGYSMIDAAREHFAGPDREQWGTKTHNYGIEVMQRAQKYQNIGAPAPSAQPAAPQQSQRGANPDPSRYRPLSADEVKRIEQAKKEGKSEIVLQIGMKPIKLGNQNADPLVTDKNKDANLFTDTGNLLLSGVNKLGESARELTHRIPITKPTAMLLDKINEYFVGKTSEQIFAEADKHYASKMSAPTAKARQKLWVVEPGDKLDDGTTAKGWNIGPAWKDPRAYYAGIVESVPELAVSMGGSLSLARGAFNTAIKSGATREAASKAAAKTATLAGSFIEGGLGGASSAVEVRKKINELPDNVLQQSDVIKELMNGGMTLAQAKKEVAEKSATKAFVLAGVGTGVFGGLGDRAIAKIITEGSSSRIKSALSGAVAEGVFEEMPQSAASQVAQNYAVQDADPNQRLMQGVANQAAGGLALGAAMGGGIGAATHRAPQAEQGEQDQAPDVQPALTEEQVQIEQGTAPERKIGAIERAVNDGQDLDAAISAEIEAVTGQDNIEQLINQPNTTPTDEGTSTATAEQWLGAPGTEVQVSPKEDPNSVYTVRVEGYQNGEVFARDADGTPIQFGQNDIVSANPVNVPEVSENADVPAPETPAQQPQAQEQPKVETPAQPETVTENVKIESTEIPTLTDFGVTPAETKAATQADANLSGFEENTPQAAPDTPRAEPVEIESPEKTLAKMDEAELRARIKYLADQAKASGGWNKRLMEERRKVEAQINKNKEQKIDDKPYFKWEGMSPAERMAAAEKAGIDADTARDISSKAWGAIDKSITDQLTAKRVPKSKAAPKVPKVEQPKAKQEKVDFADAVPDKKESSQPINEVADFERLIIDAHVNNPPMKARIIQDAVKAGRPRHQVLADVNRIISDYKAGKVPAATVPQATNIEGKDLGDGWSEFSKDSGSLGIPRSDMPQIKAEHRGAMVNFMNARDIAHKEETVPASSLKPTQAEFSKDRVKKASEREGGDRSILVSKDDHVLDGHHQWMAAREKGEDVKIIRLDAPITDLVDAAHEFPSSTMDESQSKPETKVKDTQPEKTDRPALPERYNVGPFSGKTKPINKTLYREMDAEGLNDLVRVTLTNGGGDLTKIFVTDNIDLAIGQGKNKGILVQMRGDAVSGEEHYKPGTSDLTGREYQTDFIGMDAIDQIHILQGTKLRVFTRQLIQARFDRQNLDDGSVLFTRKGVDIGQPLNEMRMDNAASNAAPSDIKTKTDTPSNTAYQLPEHEGKKYIYEDWMGSRGSDYAPTDRQMVLIDATKQALNELQEAARFGVVTNDDLQDHVAKILNVPQKILDLDTLNVKGGDFGYDVYQARQHIESLESLAKQREALKKLNLSEGKKIGTIVLNDGKLAQSTVVESFNEQQVVLMGTRGGRKYKFTTHPIGLVSAIKRAVSEGKRKDNPLATAVEAEQVAAPTVAETKTPKTESKKELPVVKRKFRFRADGRAESLQDVKLDTPRAQFIYGLALEQLGGKINNRSTGVRDPDPIISLNPKNASVIAYDKDGVLKSFALVGDKTFVPTAEVEIEQDATPSVGETETDAEKITWTKHPTRKIWNASNGMIITDESYVSNGTKNKNFFVYRNQEDRNNGVNFARGESVAEAKKLAQDNTDIRFSRTDLTDPKDAESGKPINAYFSRNTVSSKNYPQGMDFGQDLEPAGEYMNIATDDMSVINNPGWQYGLISFKNPLVLEHKSTDSTGWKKDLSEMYNGKTGKALSAAIKKAGYDAVVTKDKYGYSEVVNLSGEKYQFSKTDDQPKNLFVAHNLSASNILAANDLGGLAAPSIAVARSDVSDFSGYGEVTLLADPKLLEDSKIRTFDADIYSPRQPRAHYNLDKKKFNELMNELEQNGGDLRLPSLDDASSSDGAENFVRSDAMQLAYLTEINKAPKLKQAKVNPHIKSAAKLEGSRFSWPQDPKFAPIAKKYFESRIAEYSKPIDPSLPEDAKEVMREINQKGMARAKARYYNEDGSLKPYALDDLAKKADDYRKSGGYDYAQLRSDISEKMRNEKTRAAFEKWATEKFNSMVTGKTLFKGFNNAGNKKYLPYTLENVVADMTQQLQAGEGTFYGAGSARSAYANEMKTIRDIQDRRDQIVTSEDMERIKEESSKVFEDAIQRLKPFYKYDTESWGYANDAGSAISEGAKGIREAFRQTPESKKIIADLTDYLRNLPTNYFEAKAQRAVQFSEFNTAIVPKGMDKQALQVLRDAGLKIKTYDPKDKADRARVIAQQEKLLFSQGDAGAGTGTTVAQVRESLVNRFDEKTIAKLERDGTLSIVDSFNIPNVEGFARGKQVTLVANALTPDTIIPTFLHELGGHVGFQGVMKPQAHKNLIDQFNKLVAAKDPIALEAKRLAERETDPNVQQDEYLPYLVTVAARTQQVRPGVRNLISRIVSAVKAWAFDRLGVNLPLNANDITALAERMVNAIGENHKSGSGESMFSRADQTDTPEFKEWFGDSKVVDEDDEPLVVYHGTDADFTEFKTSQTQEVGDYGAGFYLTQDRYLAQGYAEKRAKGDDGARVMPLYVSMKNPFIINIDSNKTEAQQTFQPIKDKGLAKKFTDDLKAKGHDGVIVKLRDIDDSTKEIEFEFFEEVIAFSPDQIKSATDNVGTFDGSNPDIRFSRADDDLGTVSQAEYDSKLNQWWKEAKQMPSDALTNSMRGWGLGLVPLRPMLKEIAKDIPAAQTYLRVKDKMDALRNEWHGKVDAVAQDWLKYRIKNREENRELMDIMHESTLEQVDPSKPFQSLMTPKERISLENPSMNANLRAELTAKMDLDAKREEAYDKLKIRYDDLSPEARSIFEKVRDAYSDMADAFDKTLLDNMEKAINVRIRKAEREYKREMERIKDEGMEGTERDNAVADAERALKNAKTKIAWNRKARLTQLRQQFETQRLAGPYFPLARFGQLFVTVRDAKTSEIVSFSRFEKAQDQRRFADEMEKDKNYKVERGALADAEATRKAVDPNFVADVEDILSDLPNAEQIKDDVWQRYLESLPDMSIRKSRIHRKGRAGYISDAVRAFGHHLFHGSHQLARMTYSMDLEDALDQARDEARETKDPTRSGLVVNEIEKRHQFVMNPTGGQLATWASSFAFVWYLAGSPKAALMNLFQTPIMGIPILAAYDGQNVNSIVRAGNQLTRALVDFTQGKGYAERSSRLTAEERDAMEKGYETGIIEKTQGHELAGVAESGVEYNAVRERVMKVVSWGFHHTERLNREVTFLAAYRIARNKGVPHEQAISDAGDLVWKTHFDYSNTSRPRLMHSDTMKILLVFRNFQLNMLFRLFRDIHQAMHADSKGARREALTQLAGVTGMMMLNAGITGTWLFGVAMLMAGLFLDDGEDPEEELKKGMVNILGPNLAGLALYGVPGHTTGTALSESVGMPDLWFRSPDSEKEGEEAMNFWVSQLLGAVPAIAAQMFRGVSYIKKGEEYRGIETMLPKMLKDPMKAYRYATEGAKNMKGDTVTDVRWPDVVKQATGFTPARISEQYKINNLNYNKQQLILKSRKQLMDDYYKATQANDEKAVDEVLSKIEKHNDKNPDQPITAKGLIQSAKTRQKGSENAVGGMRYNNKLRERILEDQAPSIYK